MATLLKSFKTHTDEIVKGKKLKIALNEVVNDLVDSAYRKRKSSDWANHITEQEKDDILENDLKHAREVWAGKINSLAVAQRLNTKLTGECIALLP